MTPGHFGSSFTTTDGINTTTYLGDNDCVNEQTGYPGDNNSIDVLDFGRHGAHAV